MNNESVKSSKINYTTVSTTSISANHIKNPSSNISNSETTAKSFSSISSASSSLSSSAQFDVTVSAIAAVVNASNQLPVTTPSNAAAVVAVAVSSLAAAIIPDIPIVSIAGSTFSEITTTTTSTKTTPTPVPTSKETGGVSNNSNSLNTNSNKNANHKGLQNKSSSSPSSTEHPPPLTSYSTSSASVKGLDPMSVANSSVTGALTNAQTTAANAAAAEIDSNANSTKQLKDNSTGNTAKGSSTKFCGSADTKSESLSATTESKTATATNSSNSLTSQPTTANTIKNEDVNVTPNETKSKEYTSDSWEESRLKDWDDSKLKELLDEAYSYKNPRDKENKSKTFLQLLEKAENEDQSYPFCVTSRGSRNLSNSITSNSYNQYQQNSHYHSHSHNHNRSQYKQGGSLQDLFEIGLHESQLDCDQTFGIGISSNQRTRRQNHNSRQKKYSSSVSSRQREGGSLPSNVNATHQLNVGVSGVVNDLSLMQQEGSTGICTSKASKKEQRRNSSKAAASTANVCTEAKENNTSSSVGETTATGKNITLNTTSAYTADGGDFIIDMGEPMMDIQQQQKILQCKGQDAATQGHPFYERLANNDKRIPRANIIGSAKGTYFAPTTSHCYVDETVRFNALERNGGTNNGPTSSTIDAKFLPLDENYKSCKSVLGSDSEKSPEILSKSKSNTIYTKISAPASGSAVLTGTTNNIATLAQRQLDENGNAVSEIYQNLTGAGAGSGATIQINAVSPTAANASAALLNSCGNVSTSATVTISPHTASTTVSTSATVTTTFTSGPSQAKAKAKKKSQQERNTTTVDVESVAGYRGKDPVEELVKYIESSGEDKQAGSGSGSKSGDKKKERKKDKEKHQKLKKSNSLEELRSGAKMEVHELKRTAATTESNAVLVRQKSSGGGKQNKNNSSSTADINKNLEGKNSTQTTNSRKSDRKSWGNEDLKYLEDQQNANVTNEDKTVAASTHTAKERKSKVVSGNIGTSTKEEKDIKDKTNERNERNLANNVVPTTTIQFEKSDRTEKSDKFEKFEKLEKTEKSDKAEKSEKQVEKSEKRKKQDIPPNAVTVVDILAIESVLPETAEFHVVTKKKKPKKQKVINNLEETTVTFNRTHNFTMQKTSTFNQQQQQMTVRYKYYHHDNASNTGISNTNTNSQNYQQASSQQHQQSSSNFNSSNVVHTQHQNQQQHQQQQQQHNSSENYTNTTDKSRRKSTSSVPPSEKSDSSDLDSVHSLPIESSKVNATSTASKTAKGNTQQRTKSVKNNNASLANNNSSTASKNQNSPAPISYADIARTNKEIADAAASASGILINNNEISTECRNSDAPQTNTADSLAIEDKTGAANVNTVTTSSVTTVTNAATKPHKTKKSQIKQDFPELSSTSAVFNDDKVVSTNANHKTITYSQSLTAVTNLTQNTTSTQSHGTGGFTSASDSSPVSSTDVNTKASPTDHHRNLIIHQHAHIPPVQHPQQQILQKSKSVENDSSSTSTNSTLSTANNYMASLNSNNLDQQYPALEKTVKRHSSATIIGTATNVSNLTPFNFAAAAKQQMTTNVFDQNNINLNKNSALTTSNTTNSNIITQAALLMSTNSNEGISGSISTININTNKKSKEKSPPLSATTNSALTQDSSVNSNTPNLTTTTLTNPKKSKKERQQQQQQQLQMQQSSVDSSQVKHNQNNNSNPVTNKKPFKTQLRSSNSLPLGLTSSSSSGSHTNSTTSTVNRPAVIILNDDRNSGSCAADNQFTFGDFNEEELKLFEDDSHATVVENPIDNIDINANQSEEEEKHQQTAYSEAAFNDSGASCGNDMANNSTSDMLLSSSIDASSPNTSFVANCHGNNGGVGAIHMPALINNQSSDSGIYTDKTKSSNSSCSSNSSNVAVGGSSIVTSMQKQKQQMSPTKEENNKLNTFLTNTKCASVHTSMDNLNPPPPPPLPPQQLETCNDIETAIIAAARAAAKHQQAPHSHHQHQKQQYKNSNTSSNSSSFSSSSLSSTTSAYQHHKQQKQQHHHNSNINSNRNYQNQHGSGNTVSYHQPHHHYDDDYDDNDDDSIANTPRSRSPSRPRRISIAGGTVVNKEFDIHFIPPTTMPTAFSTQHHNDVIIDFIGSAWEEVANSKVTKVYDGQ